MLKSRRKPGHVNDLIKVFVILRKYKLRLNATKCALGVGSGKFYGHLVTKRGFESNPKQIISISNLVSSRTINKV